MDQIVTKGPGISRKAKVWMAAAFGVAVALALLGPAVRRWARAEQSVDLSRLQVATVVRGDLERDAAAQGRVVAANHPKLYSPAQGIVSLAVRPGAAVKAGQVLATIASPDLDNSLKQERSRLESLESELARTGLSTRQQNEADEQALKLRKVRLEAAHRDLVRAETLRKDGLLNQVDYERAKDAVRVAEVELEQAEGGGRLGREARDFEVQDRQRQIDRQRLVVADLERRVGELSLRAPFDGMVATIDVQDRDALAPNAAVLTVVDLSQFEVEAQIPETYADEAVPGTPSVVSYGGRDYPAELTAISPEVQAGQVQGRVKFKGGTPEGLRQSLRVAVRLIFEKRPNVLKVPRGPFLESGGGRRAYVLADGLATLRPMKVGATSVSEVEIVDGLHEGEQVLLSEMEQFNGAKTVLVRK
ncbi:MAG TPA: HlyD family efflux transporter periplasmic adaptor subunit [Thermoanaerobaculia bacterium]|nr:HlyD family efflux transporter periplasmic adaptor subunit [Thermoanaerobaculia bacterium]